VKEKRDRVSLFPHQIIFSVIGKDLGQKEKTQSLFGAKRVHVRILCSIEQDVAVGGWGRRSATRT